MPQYHYLFIHMSRALPQVSAYAVFSAAAEWSIVGMHHNPFNQSLLMDMQIVPSC